MAKKNFSEQYKEKAELGKLIAKYRDRQNYSLRKFADAIGLPASNLYYIETGVNAPTAEIYNNITLLLRITKAERAKLDKLYGAIRKVPPPDICEILINNPSLYEKIRNNQKI